MNSKMLSKEQKDIIYGTLLGDGYLNKRGTNVRLQLVHGPKQENYIKWKAEKLHNIITPRGLKKNKYKDNHSKLGYKICWDFYTETHDYLKYLYNILYPNGVKTFTKENLSLLTPLSLAVWLMDDGNLNKRKGRVRLDGTRSYVGARFRICTCTKDPKQEELIVKVLNKKFDLDFKVCRHKDYFMVYCTTDCFKKLVDIVNPFVIPSMNYKFDINFLGKEVL